MPPAAPGRDDDFLLRADRNPNTRGAELIGLGGDAAALLAAARAGRIRCLLIFDHDLLASGLPAADVSAALGRIETVIYAGTNANATSAAAHWVLPTAAWVERDGTFTNFEGRVQRFRQAVDPIGQARPGVGSARPASWPRSAARRRARGPSTGSARSPAPSRPSRA